MPSVRCPGCEAALKLKAAPPAGKRLKCPKCGAAFAPKFKRPAPEPTGESWDDWEDPAAPAAPAPPPSPRARRAAGGGRKTRSKKAAAAGGVPRVVWIGLAAAAAAVVAGAGIYFAVYSAEAADAAPGGVVFADRVQKDADDLNPAGAAPGPTDAAPPAVAAPDPSGPLRAPAAAPFPTAYLPADADVFVHVRVADLWNDPLLAAATPTAARLAIPAALAQYDIDVAKVDSLTLGGPLLAGFREMSAAAADAAAGAAAGQRLALQSFPKFLAVLRLAEPYEPKILTPDGRTIAAEPRDFAGQRLYDLPPLPQVRDVSFWMPDDSTLVIGKRDAVEAAAGRGDAAVERPGFAGVAAGDAVAVALAGEDGLLGLPTEADTRRRDPGFPPPSREAEQASTTWGVARRRAAGVALGVSVGGPPVFTLTMPGRAETGGDPEALAAALRDLLTTLIETADPRGQATPAWKLLVLDVLDAGTVEAGPDAARLTLPMPADLRARSDALAGRPAPADGPDAGSDANGPDAGSEVPADGSPDGSPDGR